MRPLLLVASLACLLSGCGSGAEGDVLPGRTRSFLEHDWPHPRDLAFTASTFEPPDAVAALYTAANGLRAYIVADSADPIVQVTAALPLGRAFEREGETAAAELLARQLVSQVEQNLSRDVVARVQTEQDVDLTRLSVQVLAEDWRRALNALLGTLRGPRLDSEAIAAYRTGPGYARPPTGLGGTAFRPAVELQRLVSGYAVAPPDSGLSVRPEAVRSIAGRTLHPRAVVLGIGGGVTREAVEKALRELTDGWTDEPAPELRVERSFAPARLPDEPLLAIEEPGYTSWIAIGHALPPIAPPDEAAVAVMAEVLNIRLNIATREIRGLTNRALLQMPTSTDGSGVLHVRTGGRPESVAPLIHYILEELSRIRQPGGLPTEDELEQAKGGLAVGAWQRSLDGARNASATYTTETARRGSLDRLLRWPEAVRAVTTDQVQAAAERYVQPDRLTAVLVGQLDAIDAARHPRWPFTLDEVRSELRRPMASRE